MTSLIALTSILGSSLGGYTFLDPIGGIAVSLFILRQGFFLTRTAFLEMMDAGISNKAKTALEGVVLEMVDGETLLGVSKVRGVKAGGGFNRNLPLIFCRTDTCRPDNQRAAHDDSVGFSCCRAACERRADDQTERGQGGQDTCPRRR